MNFKLLLLACIAASVAVTQISAQCFCDSQVHNGGQNVCVGRSRVVHPIPGQRGALHSRSSSFSNHVQQFNPVGDRCSCGNTVVEPAIRPACRCQRRGLSQSDTSLFASERSSITSESSSNCGHITQAPFDSANIYSTRDSNNIIQKDYSSLLPADPFSMTLAYKAAQRATIAVPEEKLSFGFKRAPANAANKKPVPNIPEEKLFTYDRNVVELQDTKCQKHKKIEEEEEEEEEEQDEEEDVEVKPGCGGLGYLNYKQLGYYPQKHIDNRFDIATSQFEIESQPLPSSIDQEESFLEIGNCGYRPGRIVDMNKRGSSTKVYSNNGQRYIYEGFA